MMAYCAIFSALADIATFRPPYFGFWILDFGFIWVSAEMQNPKSKIIF
jgi:hypothetical protein